MKRIYLPLSLLLVAIMPACHPVKHASTRDHVHHSLVADSLRTRSGTSQTDNPNIAGKTDTLLTHLLQRYPEYFDHILHYPDSFRVQIIYTQIDRGANNVPSFKNFYYRVDPSQYFYPASTVKMPTALLALQRVHELEKEGVNINSSMITGQAYSAQTPVYNDPTTPDGRPTIAQYIRKIFLVSDNDAYNRLYEFLGQDYLNKHLRKMGYKETEIIHHLELFMTEDENRHTNPITFLQDSGQVIYQQPMQVGTLKPLSRKDLLGKGFVRNGKLVNEPFNFSRKNRIGLESLHEIVRSIMFPQSVPARQRFDITPEDYQFVWKYMSQFPTETISPQYDSSGYQDAYCKYLYWGGEKGRIPKNFRIFNKIGDAYGFLVDAAYFVGFDKGVEFLLSATILSNSDGVFNDSRYDYDRIGFPFMKHLGRVIYDYELRRPKMHAPDLSAFKILYDK